ncbi:serine/threonine-protein kinase RIO3 [Parasteatoda tepidariorum]|uniref:serine/threonine-protein kinase RIO3 n=1 Tax=Parasteatoda tepidariorum TaxID=114398 RepID=UPI0039BCFD4E
MDSEVLVAVQPQSCIQSIPTPVVPTDLPVKVPMTNKCPWGQIKPAEAVSLNDVMSEQLITNLVQDNSIPPVQETVVIDDLSGCGEEITDHSDDYLLAQLLQLEFDKEHDNLLQREESKYNGDSKVKVTFGKYRRLPYATSFSSDEEDEDKEYYLEQSAKNHWHNFEQAEKTFQAVGRSGVSRQGGVMTSKHDPTMCGRRNAGRLMEFPPGIKTGDGGMFDMKFSNNVYNSLRTYSVAENKRGQRLHDKREKSTAEKALDEKTSLILFKLLNNKILKSLTGCISTGKEACVYHAWSGMPEEESSPEDQPSPEDQSPPEEPVREFAIKVFKTTLNEFINRDQYIKDDHRFKYRFSKQNPRKVIHMWAEKEMRNLLRMKEANISCPEVIALKKHVLVMTFIGKDMLPAPKLRDVDLPFEDMTIIFEQTVDIMKDMYTKCKLVHADFSEYNLLWYEDKTWVIDVSQAVEITHPRSLEYLLRDCTNISNFFDKKGVKEVPSPEDLFFQICGQRPLKSDSVPSTKLEE